METKIYENLINELIELKRPDYEIEEVGYFWNELVVLKKEKMPLENIFEEIEKFQRIVIDNKLTSEDEEELYEELSKKQLKKEDLISLLKEDNFYSPEEFDLVGNNIDQIIKYKKQDTLSEMELFKYNAQEYQKALEEEKEALNYQEFDYVSYLKLKIKNYEIN